MSGRERRGADGCVSEVVDVSENNSDAASGSVTTLNSDYQTVQMRDIPPTGVMFPGMVSVPPITITSRTIVRKELRWILPLENVSGSSTAARARLVNGPRATMVTLSTSSSLNNFKISVCAVRGEGTKCLGGSVRIASQAFRGVKWGCYDQFHC